MYIWNESVASRGAQEIASCLMYHIKNHIPENCKELILWSDSCPGQNKNIKISLMLKKLLNDDLGVLNSIQQKYFVSGHSYNSCDRSFAIIERARRNENVLFVPNDWVKLIKYAKRSAPQFVVKIMKSGDFFSSKLLEDLITNRKKTTENQKFNWFHLTHIILKKNEPFLLHIAERESLLFKTVSLQKRGVYEDRLDSVNLQLLYENGRKIESKKYRDLLSLLRFIPENYHNFYKNLKFEKAEIENDFGLASDESDE